MAMANGLLLALFVLVSLIQLCVGTRFNVGGTNGWDLSSSGYQTWADGNTYHVGDTLAFTYSGAMHSVVETDAAGFQACSSSNAITQDSSGNTVVPLKTAGKHYFICGTPGHCAAGMKFSTTVLPSASPSSGSATPNTSTTPSNPTTTSVDSSSATTIVYQELLSAGMTISTASMILLLL